jgi:glyoxylase I family protein
MFKGIEHTAIATPDPESLAQWYEKKLSFPICHRYGGNVFVKAPDGTMLELIPSVGDPVKTEIKTPGIRHLAIKVDDFDEGVRKLEQQGIEIFDRVEGGANRLAFFRDPEGNILHLIYRDRAL